MYGSRLSYNKPPHLLFFAFKACIITLPVLDASWLVGTRINENSGVTVEGGLLGGVRGLPKETTHKRNDFAAMSTKHPLSLP